MGLKKKKRSYYNIHHPVSMIFFNGSGTAEERNFVIKFKLPALAGAEPDSEAPVELRTQFGPEQFPST